MKNKILISIILFGLTGNYTTVSAQTESNLPPIINVYNRPCSSLDGQWQIITDPMEIGYYNHRYKPNPNGFFRNKKVSNKTELLEYNFETGDRLNVPGDWNSQNRELLWYEGTIWYKKDFAYAKKENKRVFLHFGAINYDAKVYLNGEKLGDHIGGFTPFGFEITDAVKNGDNFVVVKVNNTRRLEAIPTLNSDWWNYGGITRSVNIVEVPKTFIHDYFIQLGKGQSKQAEGYIRLSGASTPHRVTIAIPELKFEQIFRTDETGYAKISFSRKFELWSPENPKQYKVVISAADDNITDEIGFRTIETKGRDILLNGKSIFLRGVCIHEEAAFRGGRAHSAEDVRVLLGWAKEMGCNFVRLAHYTHNEHMIREAEKMGILVWAEIPLYWTIQWENPAVSENAKRQFFEMFHRDKNRAAIILWSIANETPMSDERLKFLGTLAQYARSLDTTRLLTAALEYHIDKNNPNTVLIDDPLGKYLDVIGCNEYFGWYNTLPEKSGTLTWTTSHEKPLIMSEFGAGALAGFHGDKLDRWTEEYQEYFFTENIGMLKKVPFLRGTTPWALMDFRSPRRLLSNVQDGYNRKGVISDQGKKKKAFYVIKDYYNELQNKSK